MHLIESLFGSSPDGGSGLLEYGLIAIPFCIFVLRAVLKCAVNGPESPRPPNVRDSTFLHDCKQAVWDFPCLENGRRT
jgi:hypothetical protein